MAGGESAGGGCSTIRSQNRRALGRVAYENRVHGGTSPRPAGAECEVPVEQEERGQALLPVERLEPPVVDLAVDEVQADRLAAGDRLVQSVEKGAADLVDPWGHASLGVVALDQRDLDVRHPRRRLVGLREHAGVGGGVALHDGSSPSSGSGSSGASGVKVRPEHLGHLIEVVLSVARAPEMKLLRRRVGVVLQEDVARADRDVRPPTIELDNPPPLDLEHRVAENAVVAAVEQREVGRSRQPRRVQWRQGHPGHRRPRPP